MGSDTVKLDPVYAASCEEYKKRPKIEEQMIPSFPKMNKASDEHFQKVFSSLPKVIEEDITVSHNGTELRLTLLRPLETETQKLPVVIYYHGGGWVFGSKYTYAKAIRDLCIKCHVAIVFLNYTLAPEAKFPVAHEEAYSTLCWILENGDSIMVDTKNLALCGDSAGGNLASVVPLMAKDRGIPGDAIKAQVLIYPALTVPGKMYDSYELFGNGDYGLTLAEGMFFHKIYYGDNTSKYISPLLATDDELRGLPPALVFTAEADIIRDIGEEYASKLLVAGVPTAATRLIGSIHGFFEMAADTPAYTQTVSMINTHLQTFFTGAEPTL